MFFGHIVDEVDTSLLSKEDCPNISFASVAFAWIQFLSEVMRCMWRAARWCSA